MFQNNWSKLVAGLIFGLAGVFLLSGTNTSKSIVSAQTASTTYTVNWKATQVFAINTVAPYLPVEFSNTSSRDWFAIGPSRWSVEYFDTSNGNTLMARETWVAPTPNCYYYGTPEHSDISSPCAPGNSNAGAFLYGIVSEYKMRDYKNMSILSMNVDDPRLYNTDSVNPRFQGPGSVGETNQSDNIDGYTALGAYGWLAGKIGTAGRDTQVAAGIMMPLKWTVSGEIF